MKIGMTLPGMDPGLDRARLVDWTRRIEAGPFETLAFGERMAFYNPELIAMFGACAVLTERVQLRTTVLVMPIHQPVLLAKQLATLDVLSNGRLSVGIGIGGRAEDVRAVSGDPARQKNAVLAREIEIMRRVWRGESVVDGLLRPVEPRPVRAGGRSCWPGRWGRRRCAGRPTGRMGCAASAGERRRTKWLRSSRSRGRPGGLRAAASPSS